MRTKSVDSQKSKVSKAELRLAKDKPSSLLPPNETNKDRIVNHGPTLWQKERHTAGDKLAYSVKEAAEALGVSPWYIRDEMAHGHLAFSCPRGRQMIPRWELVRYLETNMDPATLPIDDYEDRKSALAGKQSCSITSKRIMA